MQPTVAIVGNIRTFADARGLKDPAIYTRMKQEAMRIIVCEFGLLEHETTLVCSGTAWGGHVAVSLFIERQFRQLEIHTPFVWESTRFKRIGKGQAATLFHRHFSKTIHGDSLRDINTALAHGASMFSEEQDDAAYIKACTHIIAFTMEDIPNNFKGIARVAWRIGKHAHKRYVQVPLLTAPPSEDELCIEEDH